MPTKSYIKYDTKKCSRRKTASAENKTYMMFALCTAVTFFRSFLTAYSNANFAIRIELALVMILRHSTTPGTL